ncbi:SPOR domain-containing protein [Rhodobacter ferrooxidans]|uniref:Sporulation domain protein n=1 Tax=Rhodobacter ferrooxidans TaxID=371731 RepID=C8RZL4_9RHOB|nr:SPOR domain-containing protein [Rhodobacter sp. SW2]EEW25811.1 Sporulation domain protein [Rhodobacter sp. SW2]
MADVDFDEFEDSYGTPAASLRGARGRMLTTVAGGLTSLALILGLGYWGYKIAVRDVMGVPVIRALEGPMRVAPENPGGAVAAHQGLAVNDIAAVGTAAAPAERLVLAPRPVELSLDDAPGLAEQAPVMVEAEPMGPPLPSATPLAVAPAAEAFGPPIAPAAVETAAPAENAPADTAPADNAIVLALADALAADPPPPNADPETEAVVPGGVARSLRPLSRPETLVATAATTSASVSVTEIDPATLAVGTRLVQLGAYDDVETARADWDKLALQFGDLLAGKGRVVQAAQSGGRTFYRLRAHGFESEDDARRFCSALLAENAACIPVAVR